MATHDFTDFPSAKFREIWTQHTAVGEAMNLFETEFENFPVRGRVSKKRKKNIFFPTSCDFRPL